MTLITRGDGIQTLNGEDISFSAGHIFILSPADFHKNTLEHGKSYDYYGVKFPYELLDKRLAVLCSINKFPISQKLSEESFNISKEIFRRLIEEYREGSNRIASQIYMQTMIEQLVIIAMREHDENGNAVTSAFLNRALGYIYSHFSENISVADAAEYTGYTENYFNAIFKSSIGVPFGKYLREFRLNYASNMLKSCDLSITEIAIESGFESTAHFSRSFREKYGRSPSEYRKEYNQ